MRLRRRFLRVSFWRSFINEAFVFLIRDGDREMAVFLKRRVQIQIRVFVSTLPVTRSQSMPRQCRFLAAHSISHAKTLCSSKSLPADIRRTASLLWKLYLDPKRQRKSKI